MPGETLLSHPIAYLNGQWLPAAAIGLPLWDAGVVLGASVSEMTRTFSGRPYRLGEHVARLLASARSIEIDPGHSAADLQSIAQELAEQNGRLLQDGQELGITHFITPGATATFAAMAPEPTQARPTVCVHTFPPPLARWSRAMRSGARLVTPSVRQIPSVCIPPAIKCRSRMHYWLAEREARGVDPEALPLLLDLDGRVTESSSANVIIVRGGALVSPPAHRILPGVSLSVVGELARELGLEVEEADLTIGDVESADEVLLTSTPYCLLAVSHVNGKPVGPGIPGAVFARLLSAWSEQVGVDIGRQVMDAAKPTLA